MDTAKGCNFLLTNGGRMEDYWGVGKATRPMLPLIAIPTTAGTGSECQSFALITHPQTHVKMACGDPKAAARVAILDPELTLTQPPAVAAATGMDALSHAIETAVTRRRNPISQMLSREAFRLCARGLGWVFEHPQDVKCPGRRAPGGGLGRHGHREQHAGGGPRGGQSAHGPLWRDPWTCRRPDAAGRGAIQRPGPGGGAALSPVGPARRADRGRVQPTARRPGRRSPAFFAVISRRPDCRDRLPASKYPMAISNCWPRTLPSNGRGRSIRDRSGRRNLPNCIGKY